MYLRFFTVYCSCYERDTDATVIIFGHHRRIYFVIRLCWSLSFQCNRNLFNSSSHIVLLKRVIFVLIFEYHQVKYIPLSDDDLFSSLKQRIRIFRINFIIRMIKTRNR